jgi:hypothetical protein
MALLILKEGSGKVNNGLPLDSQSDRELSVGGDIAIDEADVHNNLARWIRIRKVDKQIFS